MIGPFVDHQNNPILAATTGLQSKAVFNPTVIVDKGKFNMLYRAQSLDDELTGRIMLAKSADGFRFTPLSAAVVVPEHDYEKFGCEDPRVVKFGDIFYLTYSGAYARSENLEYYGQACLATSKDLHQWEKHGPLLKPQEGSWCSGGHKSAAIVPSKLSCGYVMYFEGWATPRPEQERIGIAYSQDLMHWQEDPSEPVLLPREDSFDIKGVEPGCALMTEEGILLLYNSWNWNYVFSPGWALFSKEEPSKLIARCTHPLLTSEERIIFAEGLVRHRNRWLLYYGAADRACCLAIWEEK